MWEGDRYLTCHDEQTFFKYVIMLIFNVAVILNVS